MSRSRGTVQKGQVMTSAGAFRPGPKVSAKHILC